MSNYIKKVKICFAASTGGHYEQLMMLKPLMNQYEGFILTEKTTYSASVPDMKSYYVKQINRKEILVIPKFLMNCITSLIVLHKEKPDIVICTGVLAMIPMCLIAKIFKKKLIYIESFAKVKSPTISGKVLYRFADRFYVQWEDMLKVYPNAIYKGGIY